MRFKILWVSLIIIFFSFPSICYSDLKTVEGEYCGVYSGDMNNKKELEQFKTTVKINSINDIFFSKIPDIMGRRFRERCLTYIITNYWEKIILVSHTENRRKICDKVQLPLDTKVINKYLEDEMCQSYEWDTEKDCYFWCCDIDKVLTKKNEKINVGLLIEIKLPKLEESKKEQLENEQEKEFLSITGGNKDKYKIIDRRHLIKILEEQKLQSSGITDSETVKVGKLLNLDIIVLRLIYDKTRVTKVLKVDTGEVLLFKTYETERGMEDVWIYYGISDFGEYYYDKSSITNVSSTIIKVWTKNKHSKVIKDRKIQLRKKYNQPTDGWDKLSYNKILYEIDCINNTEKIITTLEYNDEGKVIDDYEIPNPTIEQIVPDSMGWDLLRTVCPNK